MDLVAPHCFNESAELTMLGAKSRTERGPWSRLPFSDFGGNVRDDLIVADKTEIPPLDEGSPAAVTRSLSVFQQKWWIDTASKLSRCSTVSAIVAGRTVGTLTYVTHRNKIGARLGLAPFWSHLGGPVLEPDLDRDEQRDAIRQIAQKLPKGISFRFACDPNCSYADIIVDEFAAAGFSRDDDPTYLHMPEDGDALDRMKARHRAHIRSARRVMTVADGSVDEFIQFYEANLSTRSHSPVSVARDLLKEGMDRGQAKVFLARRKPSESGGSEIDAAVASAWDDHRYYYWMSARRKPTDSDIVKPNGDATKVLILAAMQHARELGLVFDADSPESAGGRALFHTVFGFDRVEQRIILLRATRITRLYNHVVPIVKARIKAAFPNAPIYDPKASLRETSS